MEKTLSIGSFGISGNSKLQDILLLIEKLGIYNVNMK